MAYKYGQKLPAKVEKDLDAYIERIKAIRWLKPSPNLKKETVDTAVKAALSAFGVEASIEYRSLKTKEDCSAAWSAARDAARDAAWSAARDAAWSAARDAARDAASGAARDAASGAAWDAAWDAAWGAAWGAAAWSAWSAARDAARGAARGAAWGAQDLLASHTDTYKLKTPFLRLVDLWEMGMYPCGVIDGKFVVYSPIDFDEPKKEVDGLPDELTINGTLYKRAL